MAAEASGSRREVVHPAAGWRAEARSEEELVVEAALESAEVAAAVEVPDGALAENLPSDFV